MGNPFRVQRSKGKIWAEIVRKYPPAGVGLGLALEEWMYFETVFWMVEVPGAKSLKQESKRQILGFENGPIGWESLWKARNGRRW